MLLLRFSLFRAVPIEALALRQMERRERSGCCCSMQTHENAMLRLKRPTNFSCTTTSAGASPFPVRSKDIKRKCQRKCAYT